MALSSFLLDTHPFSFAIKTDIPQVADSIEMLYGDVLRDDSTLTLPTYDVEIAQLEGMGFTNRDANLAALRATNGNVQQAIDRLLLGG